MGKTLSSQKRVGFSGFSQVLLHISRTICSAHVGSTCGEYISFRLSGVLGRFCLENEMQYDCRGSSAFTEYISLDFFFILCPPKEGKIQQVLLCVWFLWLNEMSSRFIHSVAQIFAYFLILIFSCLKFLLGYSYFIMLCQFLLNSKVNLLYVYIYHLFLGFPSHLGHHSLLSRVPCAVQLVLISYLFYTQYQPCVNVHHNPPIHPAPHTV